MKNCLRTVVQRLCGGCGLTIESINKSGVTILIVEQNAKKILSIADRGYVLATGENKIDDTGLNLLTNPDVGMLYLGGSN